MATLDAYREVVLVDTEFENPIGGRPPPGWGGGHEVKKGGWDRIFQGEFGSAPPYATGIDVLFVSYFATAELGVYHVLGWDMPPRIVDLYAEFRVRTNGLTTPAGRGLIGALAYFGCDTVASSEK